LLLLGGGFLFLRGGLSLSQRLLVSAEDSLVEFRFGLFGAGKADILVLAVSGSVAWHGDKQPLGALHDFDAPHGEIAVDIDRGGGLAAALRTDGVDFHIVLGGGWCRIVRHDLSSFSKCPASLTGVIEHLFNALHKGWQHRFPEQGIQPRKEQSAQNNGNQNFDRGVNVALPGVPREDGATFGSCRADFFLKLAK